MLQQPCRTTRSRNLASTRSVVSCHLARHGFGSERVQSASTVGQSLYPAPPVTIKPCSVVVACIAPALVADAAECKRLMLSQKCLYSSAACLDRLDSSSDGHMSAHMRLSGVSLLLFLSRLSVSTVTTSPASTFCSRPDAACR
ncbi:uncharacterized protein BKA78DRAFT_77415 [Phyllosticta capitalensis]|uniref:uncharacterized protein n=1 Tax=Phyllosticta capitalensis TaxID=121624 RepID=UPI00312DFD83